MKNQFRKYLSKILLLCTMVCGPTLILMAQDCNPDIENCDPPGTPLEGADILLIAMGAAFFAYRIWQYNRKTKAQAA